MSKEYFVVRLDALDVPCGVLTGPFSTYDQATGACEALQPLLRANERVCPVGGDTLTNSFIRAYARAQTGA